MNYCQDGIQLYYATETQEISNDIYGYYELLPYNVNDRPYFEKDPYALWWSTNEWWIGYVDNKGENLGFGYYAKDEFCPHLFSEWDFQFYDGTDWYPAGNDLRMNCKCIFIQTKLYS